MSCLGQVYGNASSIHHFGQAAKQRLEAARRQLAALIHANPNEIVFTSGGTEADNLAVLGVVRRGRRPRRGTSSPPPSSIPRCWDPAPNSSAKAWPSPACAWAPTAWWIPTMCAARCGPRRCWSRSCTPTTSWAPSSRSPRSRASPARPACRCTSDGVQALGKIPVDVDALGVDLYSMSGHKLYAPKGVGALYVRKGTRLAPIAFGGHHERDRRPGTENVPGIAAFGAAAEVAGAHLASESDAARGAARPPGERRARAASPAPASTARAGSARPTPPTSTSTASKAKPW